MGEKGNGRILYAVLKYVFIFWIEVFLCGLFLYLTFININSDIVYTIQAIPPNYLLIVFMTVIIQHSFQCSTVHLMKKKGVLPGGIFSFVLSFFPSIQHSS